MSKLFFTHDEILERPNSRFPTEDPAHVHFHFRPARPANFCVTRDPETGDVNISAGTIGPLTWRPYTMCLHIAIKGSPHSYNNLRVGGHCVVALPGRDIVNETWYTALPLLRGINEADVAGLHTYPSKFIDVPGIVECPVNFECLVEFKKDYYSHAIVFVKVLGASLEEKVIPMSREEVVNWYPTYEVDDISNEYHGDIERLGLMGDIIACPTFPKAPKAGWYKSFDKWMTDLAEEDYLSREELDKILALVPEYESLYGKGDSERLTQLKDFFTRVPSHIVRDEWDALHAMLKK